MNKEFLFYKQALELNQLGFDEPCITTTDQIEYVHIKGTKSSPRGSMIYDTIDCPLYQQAFRWFREKHNLDSHIKKDWTDGVFYGYEAIIECDEGFIDVGTFKTYEEAELECLKKLIEIVKNK